MVQKGYFEITNSEKVVFILPTGDIHGPQEQVQAVLKKDECYELKQDFKDNFSMEKLSVFLITPLAYEEGCVGEVLKAIEGSCLGIRGVLVTLHLWFHLIMCSMLLLKFCLIELYVRLDPCTAAY